MIKVIQLSPLINTINTQTAINISTLNDINPSHTKCNIPCSPAGKICTILEDVNTRKKHFAELKEFLLKQKYPSLLTENGIQHAIEILIQQLRVTTKGGKQEQMILFIMVHNSCRYNTRRIANANLIISQYNELKDL